MLTCCKDRPFAKGFCKKCYDKDYYRRNREHCLAYSKSWAKANPLSIKRTRYKYNYGVSLEEIAKLRVKQNNCCAICKSPSPGHVDHDHATGKLRGLLCNLCNPGLGNFKDKPELLRAAAEYLECRN